MNQFEIQAERLSHRECWQIARNTLRVDPRCAQKDLLQQYIDELYWRFQDMGGEYRDNPETLTKERHKHHGLLLAVMTPFLVSSFTRGYRLTAGALGQQTTPTTIQRLRADAEARADLSASILLRTTQERAPELTGDPDDELLMGEFAKGYTFSKERATAAVTYEGVRGFKGSVESALKASGQNWGKYWQTNPDTHEVQDECDDNEDAGIIPLGQEFPSGDQNEPQHPACGCTVFYTRMNSDG